MSSGIIERYCAYLPKHLQDAAPVTLLEGNTPLIPLTRLPVHLALDLQWWVKFEGLNPTGSFKDRGMTTAMTAAKAQGRAISICASTGNTAASAAAYSARAGIVSVVLIPYGKVSQSKLVQAQMHGAHICQIDGNFDVAMHLIKQLSEESGLAIVNSINPDRLQGQKTAAFEVCEALNTAPDFAALPVGNAGNISAYWMGYQDFFHHQKIKALPKMLGYQAQGAAPFVLGKSVADPDTVCSAIRIGNPQSWDLASEAVSASKGWFAALSDDEILQAQYLLSSLEGIFCEPASAASIAGVISDYRQGKIKPGSRVVSTLTGHGLKDPAIVSHHKLSPFITVTSELSALRTMLRKLL